MKNIINKKLSFFLILCCLIFLTACTKKLYPEDMRNILTNKNPTEIKTSKNKIYLAYDDLSVSDINKSIRTLMNKYNYKITKKATKVKDRTTFTMASKKKDKDIKKVKFTIYKNNNVKIEYFKES